VFMKLRGVKPQSVTDCLQQYGKKKRLNATIILYDYVTYIC